MSKYLDLLKHDQQSYSVSPASTKCLVNVDITMAQRRSHWPITITILCQGLMLDGPALGEEYRRGTCAVPTLK